MKIFAAFTAFLALFVTACAPTTSPQSQGQAFADIEAPALWRISDEDTTIYVFGTIHVLPTGHQWRNETIDTAIAASDELVIETQLSGDQSESALLLMRLGVSPDLPPIGERIPAEDRPALAAMIARGPFPETFLNGLETWAASLMLVGITLNDLDLNAENGVEDQLERIFQSSNRPISGLETPEEQLGYFDGLPEEAQRNFLVSVLESPEEIREQFESMLAAWSTGDEQAIAETFDDNLSEYEDLYDTLIVRRNVNWSQQIAERLEQPGTVFLAVGAGHLAGRDSVQVYLRRNGIQTTRIQ